MAERDVMKELPDDNAPMSEWLKPPSATMRGVQSNSGHSWGDGQDRRSAGLASAMRKMAKDRAGKARK